MRLTGDWIEAAETQKTCAMLSDAGYQALLVGGCVRNALLGMAVNDIDIATDARPQKVMELAQNAALKAVPTGIDHGTVTVIANGIAHEITTFRRDVKTDGRRAVIAFSDAIEDDASRRDFTMNALYARADGVVLDPLGGLPDLRARKVRFIKNADQRIQEDYLRSLRFFRFHAWYGDPTQGIDAEGLAAIARNLAGIETLSAERIGSELRKLLAAPDPAPSMASMAQAGVMAIVLPGASCRALAPLVHLEQEFACPPDSVRRLAALGGTGIETGLRLSRQEARRLGKLRDAIGQTSHAGELGYRLGFDLARDVLLLRSAMLELPLEKNRLDRARQGAGAVFPVKPADLMPEFQGAALGLRLSELEKQWIASGFSLTKSALLS